MTAEWVTAWGTVGLFAATVGLVVAAVFAALYAARAWKEAKSANAQRDEERRQQQASSVAAWVVRRDKGGYNVLLRNATGLPIYDLRAIVNGYGEIFVRNLVESEMGILAPGFDGELSYFNDTDAQRTRDRPVVNGEIDTRGHYAEDFRVELSFTDAAGIKWKRADNGILSEVDSLSVSARKKRVPLRRRVRAWIHRKTAPRAGSRFER